MKTSMVTSRYCLKMQSGKKEVEWISELVWSKLPFNQECLFQILGEHEIKFITCEPLLMVMAILTNRDANKSEKWHLKEGEISKLIFWKQIWEGLKNLYGQR